MMQYILDDDHTTHQATSDAEYHAQWLRWKDAGAFVKGHPKVVDKTELPGVEISTVFLGLDHSFDEGQPILFETMVFGGEHHHWCERYATWDEAARHHKRIVAALRRGEEPPEL